VAAAVPGLDGLLSAQGWPYASAQPIAPGDPGRFHALFGRDSAIASLQVLPARPEVARATLRALASLQGREEDPERDEEPGKIVHEWWPRAPERLRRAGWPVRHGELRYYGSADSTSWFLVLLA
jgi:glycogen debranching enzyme